MTVSSPSLSASADAALLIKTTLERWFAAGHTRFVLQMGTEAFSRKTLLAEPDLDSDSGLRLTERVTLSDTENVIQHRLANPMSLGALAANRELAERLVKAVELRLEADQLDRPIAHSVGSRPKPF